MYARCAVRPKQNNIAQKRVLYVCECVSASIAFIGRSPPLATQQQLTLTLGEPLN